MSDRQPDGGPGEVARRLIEATYSGDFETARTLSTPDLVLTIEAAQTVEGHSGLQQFMEFNAEVASDVRVEIHHVLGSGVSAAINRTAYLTIGEVPLDVEIGAFFTLRDGLVAEWTDYQDMQKVLRALGH